MKKFINFNLTLYPSSLDDLEDTGIPSLLDFLDITGVEFCETLPLTLNLFTLALVS